MSYCINYLKKGCFISALYLLNISSLWANNIYTPHNLNSDTGRIKAVIDVSKKGEPITPLFYGQFIELLFNYFEGGLWAEMLGDRKFFYPVNSAKNFTPINTRNYLGRWMPVGEESFVVMDSIYAYTGDHSPRIQLENSKGHGIEQKGLYFKKDKLYKGYIIISGTPEANVNVNLQLGEGKGGTISFSLGKLSSTYKKIPFELTAPQDAPQSSLQVVGTGSGSFTIGTISLMPADNVNGFRADILGLLKEMNMGMIRWGGNASSGYEWRDGIGNRDMRPPRYDYAWNAMEVNDVGTDEYMLLCKLLNVEPNIGVNAGFGDAYSAAQWVEYVNGSEQTPMGKLRAQNGHAKPYDVKWWGIGNEMYGDWQLGHMSVQHYTIKHKLFEKAMRKVDSSIIIVASGASPFETGAVSIYSARPYHIKTPYPYGSDKDWSGNLLAGASDHFDYIAEHMYPISDSAYDEGKQKFIHVDDLLVDRVRRLPNRVKGAVEAFNHYVEKMPFIKAKGIKLVIDEWRMKDGWGLEDALSTAEAYNEMFRHTDVIKLSTYTSTSAPSCLLYDATGAAIQPNGLVLKLYSTHYGTIPIEVNGNRQQVPVKGTIGVDKPTITSGSATYPLDIAAALSSDGKKLTVSVINPTMEIQNVDFTFNGVNLTGKGMVRWITGNDLKAINKVGEAPAVSIQQKTISYMDNIVTVPAASVTMYELFIE